MVVAKSVMYKRIVVFTSACSDSRQGIVFGAPCIVYRISVTVFLIRYN